MDKDIISLQNYELKILGHIDIFSENQIKEYIKKQNEKSNKGKR